MQRCGASLPVIHLKDCYDYDAVCPHDSLHFKSMEEWKDHHLEHHMDTKWECPLCGIKSSSWHNYAYHVQTSKHNKVCPSPWICKLNKIPTSFESNHRCGVRFGSKYQLIRHVRSSHSNYTLDEICGGHEDRNSRKRKFSEMSDESSSSTVSTIPSDHDLSSPMNPGLNNICNISTSPWTENMIISPHSPVSMSFPAAKRRKLSHRPHVFSIDVPLQPQMSLNEGLTDLAVNGGLNLFLNALSIFRQNEERTKQQVVSEVSHQEYIVKNGVHLQRSGR